jgi:hypothetical protein
MKMKRKQTTILLLLGLMLGAAGVVTFAQTDAGRATAIGNQVTNALPFLPTTTPDWIVQWTDQPTSVEAERSAGKQVYLPAYLPRNMNLSRIDRMVPERWNGPPPQHSLRLTFAGAATSQQLDLNQFAIFQEENRPYVQMADVGAFVDPQNVVTRTLVQGNPALYYSQPKHSADEQATEDWTHTLVFRIDNYTFTMFGNIGFEQMLKVAESLSPALADVQRGTGDIAPTPRPGR